MSLLSMLTLVIPTYERAAFVLRNLSYWSGQKCEVIVMDGSAHSLSVDDRAGLASNIRYLHRPISLNARLSMACDLITTRYAAMLCDDDYFSAEGLALAIAELEADPKLASCGGNCASFVWKTGEQRVSTRTHYPEQAHFNLNAEDAQLRIEQHFRHYTPAAVYAVHRTDGFRLAMQAAGHVNRCIYSAELAFEFVTAWRGKMKMINTCYWLRSMENDPINVEGSSRGFRLHQWLEDPTYSAEVAAWFSHISQLLEPDNSSKQQSIIGLLQIACTQYLAFCQEHFAGKNRVDKGLPGNWASTCAIFAARDIGVCDDIASYLQAVSRFHLEQEVIS